MPRPLDPAPQTHEHYRTLHAATAKTDHPARVAAPPFRAARSLGPVQNATKRYNEKRDAPRSVSHTESQRRTNTHKYAHLLAIHGANRRGPLPRGTLTTEYSPLSVLALEPTDCTR